MVLSLFFIFILGVAVCATLTRYLRDFSVSRGWVDPSDATRHLHEKPVPRLGGVAIFTTVMGLAGAALLVQHMLKARH
jgi:UDP-N-acetylmuramyl pentapeptide phosphotransferase/UDP-N-acetylglucosamine-1-phosphate transferase